MRVYGSINGCFAKYCRKIALLTALGFSGPTIAEYQYEGVSYDAISATLTWDAPIDHFHYCIFNFLTEDNPISTLVLQSYGGVTDLGFQLADYVAQQQLTVRVDNFCDSACVLPAIASPNLIGDGVLGFHLAYLTEATGIPEYDCDAIHELDHLNEELIERFRSSDYLTDEMVDWIESESTSEDLVEYSVEELRKAYAANH